MNVCLNYLHIYIYIYKVIRVLRKLKYLKIIFVNFLMFLYVAGGTLFGKHLVRDLDLQRPCSCQRRRKRCFCFRPNRNENWLFSRYSTGWKCGLHADWTELTSCVDTELNKIEGDGIKRRYFYITIIRDPVARYLSEFRHVQRGATWRGARHWCGGTQANIPQCYPGSSWQGVSLEQVILHLLILLIFGNL